MKTVIIIVAILCTDHEQGLHCYKGVVEHSENECKKMDKIDRQCDTFTVYTPYALKVGDRLSM